jgi:indole-3-glycerol phosphate synthase
MSKEKPSILDTIVNHKFKELKQDQRRLPFGELSAQLGDQPPTRDFRSALATPNRLNLIAEVKKKSPSKGFLRENFDPAEIARTYAKAGVSAVSVLTDPQFFDGHLTHLTAIRGAVDLPLLRKDFTVDPYQIYQARLAGADAILLIVAILTLAQLREFIQIARTLNLASLVEVHTEEELELALQADAEIIGVNNRNLETFETDIATTFRMIKSIPADKIVVSESGICTHGDVEALREAGVNAILVGESLMRSPNIERKIKELLGEWDG